MALKAFQWLLLVFSYTPLEHHRCDMCIRSVQSQTDGCRLSATASFCFCFALFCFLLWLFASALLWLSLCCSLRALGLFVLRFAHWRARSPVSAPPWPSRAVSLDVCSAAPPLVPAARIARCAPGCVSAICLRWAGHSLPSPAALSCPSGCLRYTWAPSARSAGTCRLVRSMGSFVQQSGDAVWF